jgi:alpha-1,3-rhamnosyl/mannosyltransferase
MRVLLDYRPALRERSGVGEYAYQLARALLAQYPPGAAQGHLELTLFSSSWKDRLDHEAGIAQARCVDRRVPVKVLNWAWHRLEWPAAETLIRDRFDVAHSPHPLLLPSRMGARVVTIHDLDFLTHPERTRGEIRRDYPALARDHAQRADQIIVSSRFTASEVTQLLGIPFDRVSVCPPGRPNWSPLGPSPVTREYVLCLGTLEPRKNIGGLLDAYETLLARGVGGLRSERVPPLVLAGRATAAADQWLTRISRPPLRGVVRHVGYVEPARRRELYEGAALLVQPSFNEGFGLPVLEAMTLGVPVVAANRGALPELLSDAGLLVDPEDPDELASAIERMLGDRALQEASVARGRARAGQFDWRRTARDVYHAYQTAIDRRLCA